MSEMLNNVKKPNIWVCVGVTEKREEGGSDKIFSNCE